MRWPNLHPKEKILVNLHQRESNELQSCIHCCEDLRFNLSHLIPKMKNKNSSHSQEEHCSLLVPLISCDNSCIAIHRNARIALRANSALLWTRHLVELDDCWVSGDLAVWWVLMCRPAQFEEKPRHQSAPPRHCRYVTPTPTWFVPSQGTPLCLHIWNCQINQLILLGTLEYHQIMH